MGNPTVLKLVPDIPSVQGLGAGIAFGHGPGVGVKIRSRFRIIKIQTRPSADLDRRGMERMDRAVLIVVELVRMGPDRPFGGRLRQELDQHLEPVLFCQAEQAVVVVEVPCSLLWLDAAPRDPEPDHLEAGRFHIGVIDFPVHAIGIGRTVVLDAKFHRFCSC